MLIAIYLELFALYFGSGHDIIYQIQNLLVNYWDICYANCNISRTVRSIIWKWARHNLSNSKIKLLSSFLIAKHAIFLNLHSNGALESNSTINNFDCMLK